MGLEISINETSREIGTLEPCAQRFKVRVKVNKNYLDFSSLAWAFICWTSIESGLRLRINRSWLPMHRSRILTNNMRAALSLLRSSNPKTTIPFTQLPTSDFFFTSLFIRTFCEKKTKFGEDFSTGFITNFLSSKLMCRISDHVKVVFGASLFSFS